MTASAAVVCALLLATGPSHRRRSPAARRSSALLLAESESTSSSSLEFESPSALPVPRQPSRREFCALVSAAVAVGGAPRATSAAEVATAPPRKALRVAEEATIKLFEGTTASVVYIDTFVEQRDAFSTNVMEVPSGTGSGFVWDLDGHIVTNYHGTARDARSSIFFLVARRSSYASHISNRAPPHRRCSRSPSRAWLSRTRENRPDGRGRHAEELQRQADGV